MKVNRKLNPTTEAEIAQEAKYKKRGGNIGAIVGYLDGLGMLYLAIYEWNLTNYHPEFSALNLWMLFSAPLSWAGLCSIMGAGVGQYICQLRQRVKRERRNFGLDENHANEKQWR